MRKVVVSLALCCFVFSVGTVQETQAATPYVEAKLKVLEEKPEVKEYINLLERKKKLEKSGAKRSGQTSSAKDGNSNQTSPYQKEEKKEKEKNIEKSDDIAKINNRIRVLEKTSVVKEYIKFLEKKNKSDNRD